MQSGLVLTKSAAARRGKVAAPVEVVFSDRRKPKPIQPVVEDDEEPSPRQEEEAQPQKQFNLRKARFEISQLCLKSMKASESKVQAKEALALSLGARPNKKKGINYKVLQEQRKQEELARLEAEKLSGMGKIMKRIGRSGASHKKTAKPSEPDRNKSQKSNKPLPRSMQKVKQGILGHYGKVTKGKIGKKPKRR